MFPKCVETIYCLPRTGKEIVQALGKPRDEKHHRDRHWFGHPPEPPARYRRRINLDRCRNEHWPEGKLTSGNKVIHRASETSSLVPYPYIQSYIDGMEVAHGS